jgi:hypothetical protein
MIQSFLIKTIPKNANICIFGKNDYIIIDLLKSYQEKSEKILMNNTKCSYYKQYFFSTSHIHSFTSNILKNRKLYKMLYHTEIPKIYIIENEYINDYNTTILQKKYDHLWFHNHKYQLSTICVYDFDFTPIIKRENIDIIFFFKEKSQSVIQLFYDRYIPKYITFEDFYEIYIQYTKNDTALVLYCGILYYYKPNIYKKVYDIKNIDNDQE